MNDYEVILKFDEGVSIDFIYNQCRQYLSKKILIEIPNTHGIHSISLHDLSPNIDIRIIGGYTEERRKRCGSFRPNNGNFYFTAVIYTRNEVIKIIEAIEKIEAGLNNNWSEFQKILYIYKKLKTSIMYDPKFLQSPAKETHSLRGLVTKKTICAGFALIFKEMMDRQAIPCEYVEGMNHAWNIIKINEKKYAIDLTWDNSNFRSGKANTFEYFGQDVYTFSEYHLPLAGEITQDYIHSLSPMNHYFIEQISNKIDSSQDYQATTYPVVRDDGTKFVVTQIDDLKINNRTYYRYCYVDILPNGTMGLPLLLYSETNITLFIDARNFKRPIPANYGKTISNLLFSVQNILDSMAKGTYYLGKINKSFEKNQVELITSIDEISKPKQKRELFSLPVKGFIRSDGSIFIAQQMLARPFNVKDTKVMQYDILEMIYKSGKYTLKRNTIFTEKNFFMDHRQNIADIYLSREQLDKKASRTGGYIGYYNSDEIHVYNPDLLEFFNPDRKIDLKLFEENTQQLRAIPTFDELNDLISTYVILFESTKKVEDPFSQFKVVNIHTGEIQNDLPLIQKVIFAHIWISAVGFKRFVSNQIVEEHYAFSKNAEELYYWICSELSNSVQKDGVIDTVGLFKQISSKNDSYLNEIIVRLFKSPFQVNLINQLFLNCIGINQQILTPEPLYSLKYAQNFIHSNKNCSNSL